MRGLTDRERIVVETWRDVEFAEDDDTPERMIARGLIRVAGTVCDCGLGPGSIYCDCEFVTDHYEVTAEGLLALRLDAAARALEGVGA